jgi:hypothetical protein
MRIILLSVLYRAAISVLCYMVVKFNHKHRESGIDLIKMDSTVSVSSGILTVGVAHLARNWGSQRLEVKKNCWTRKSRLSLTVIVLEALKPQHNILLK